MPLSVAERRAHWTQHAGWVCDACGCEQEEGLCLWETGRRTRSDPRGERVVCLCCECRERVPHGVLADQ